MNLHFTFQHNISVNTDFLKISKTFDKLSYYIFFFFKPVYLFFFYFFILIWQSNPEPHAYYRAYDYEVNGAVQQHFRIFTTYTFINREQVFLQRLSLLAI